MKHETGRQLFAEDLAHRGEIDPAGSASRSRSGNARRTRSSVGGGRSRVESPVRRAIARHRVLRLRNFRAAASDPARRRRRRQHLIDRPVEQFPRAQPRQAPQAGIDEIAFRDRARSVRRPTASWSGSAAVPDSPPRATFRAAGWDSRAGASPRAAAAPARGAGKCRSADSCSARPRRGPKKSTTRFRSAPDWRTASRTHRRGAPARCGNRRRENRSPGAGRIRTGSASAASCAALRLRPSASSSMRSASLRIAESGHELRPSPSVCSSFAGNCSGSQRAFRERRRNQRFRRGQSFLADHRRRVATRLPPPRPCAARIADASDARCLSNPPRFPASRLRSASRPSFTGTSRSPALPKRSTAFSGACRCSSSRSSARKLDHIARLDLRCACASCTGETTPACWPPIAELPGSSSMVDPSSAPRGTRHKVRSVSDLRRRPAR